MASSFDLLLVPQLTIKEVIIIAKSTVNDLPQILVLLWD
jgi:hypothetical protein